VKYFHIEGHYLNFNGKVLSKVVIYLLIKKFYSAKQINTLKVFPLHCHLNESDVRVQLLKCD
jgi:hypothetical protein